MAQRVLITGANRGIGLEMTRQLAARGAQVLAACRRPSEALRRLDVQVIDDVDVTAASAGERLRAAVGDAGLDLLIHNAGLLTRETLDDLDLDRVRRQLEVNALAPLRLTAELRDRLGRGSKVALVTSRMGSIADNTSGGMYGYRMSKAALNMAGRSLAHDLADQGVAVVLLHPGFVRTEMTGGQGFIEASEAATGLIARMDALTLEASGSFWHQSGEALPW